MRISIDLDDLTFGELYSFVDLARSARIGPEEKVTVETEDNIGNDIGAHTLSAELGSAVVESPVLLRRTDTGRYIEALARELAQESDQADIDALRHLLDDLNEATR